MIMDSKILSEDEKLQLKQLLIENNYNMNMEWDLLYRGTDNDFSTEKWQKACTNKENVIMIVESEQNNVFGGFSITGWKYAKDVEAQYGSDERAFLFLLRSQKRNKPQLFPIKADDEHIKNATASVIDALGGFGNAGHDLGIMDPNSSQYFMKESWVNNKEETDYDVPGNQYLNDGVKHFLTIEMEMFRVKEA